MKQQLRVQCRIVFTIILSAAAFGLPFSTQAKTGPSIAFNEDAWNFGKVKADSVLSHSFSFTNRGDEILVIKQVRASCGCTAAVPNKRELDPGEKGEIKVTFNTGGFEGNVKKSIYVDSNDPAQPRKTLQISAEIEASPRAVLQLLEPVVDLGLILETETIKATVRLKNSGERPLSVTLVHPRGAFSKQSRAIQFPLDIPAGDTLEAEITIPPKNRSGYILENIIIRSNDKRQPTQTVVLNGYAFSMSQFRDLYRKYKNEL